jgi:FkbM family methyltransferase
MKAHRSTQLFLRDVVATVLARIPLQLLSPIRSWYTHSRTDGLYERFLGAILNVVRHRKLGSEVDRFILSDMPDITFKNDDSVIARKLYWFGSKGHEGAEARWWRFLCKRSRFVTEIGANIGVFTVQGALAAPEVRYIAVEPHPTSASSLRENIRLNALKNVHVIEAAVVGDLAPKEIELMIPDTDQDPSPAGAFLRSGVEAIRRPAAQKITVTTIGARDVVTEADLLKLDVEGSEHAILEALWGYLIRNKPCIVIEVRRRTHLLRQILTSLCRDHGYAAFAFVDGRTHEIPVEDLMTVVLQERFGTRDLVLAAGSLGDLLRTSRLSCS